MVNHPNRAKKPLPDGLIHEVMVNPPRDQKRSFTRVIRVDGHVFRTSIHLDTSYPNQSKANLSVFIPAIGFADLLHLYGDEVRACREYHSAKVPMDNAARHSFTQRLLHDTDSQLLEIGRQIVRQG